MKVMTNLLKDAHDEWLMKTIVSLNESTSVVDRIVDDDTVVGVVVTNRQGHPIFTTLNMLTACMYGSGVQVLGSMSKHSVSEIDPFDEVLVMRLKTKKMEAIIVPHPEFNIAVIQHSRSFIHKKHHHQ